MLQLSTDVTVFTAEHRVSKLLIAAADSNVIIMTIVEIASTNYILN